MDSFKEDGIYWLIFAAVLVFRIAKGFIQRNPSTSIPESDTTTVQDEIRRTIRERTQPAPTVPHSTPTQTITKAPLDPITLPKAPTCAFSLSNESPKPHWTEAFDHLKPAQRAFIYHELFQRSF